MCHTLTFYYKSGLSYCVSVVSFKVHNRVNTQTFVCAFVRSTQTISRAKEGTACSVYLVNCTEVECVGLWKACCGNTQRSNAWDREEEYIVECGGWLCNQLKLKFSSNRTCIALRRLGCRVISETTSLLALFGIQRQVGRLQLSRQPFLLPQLPQVQLFQARVNDSYGVIMLLYETGAGGGSGRRWIPV